MRYRWVFGLCAVVAICVVCLKATLAQRPQKLTLALGIPQSRSPEESKGWKSRSDEPSPPLGGVNSTAGPAPVLADEPAKVDIPAGDDPMGAVDSFVDRSRKEVNDSIDSLSREADALRARLQKVEAALAKWQSVANALSPTGTELNSVPNPETPLQLQAIPSSPPTEPPTPAPVAPTPPLGTTDPLPVPPPNVTSPPPIKVTPIPN